MAKIRKTQFGGLMKSLMFSVPAALALVFATSAHAGDEAKTILEQAAKAHGGAENISKHKDESVIEKGKIHVSTMGVELDGTMEMSANMQRFRQDLQFSLMNQDFTQNVVFDGKELWVAINGKIGLLQDKKEDLDLIKEQIYAESAASLALMGDKSIEVSIIGEDKVGDTPVVGVRVSKKGHKDVSLYFDKETHLLKKTQFRGSDFQSHTEVEEEHILDDYKDVNGEKHPMHVTIMRDGKKFLEMEVTEVKYVEKLDDSLFEKPK
jgi:hypothetical protein